MSRASPDPAPHLRPLPPRPRPVLPAAHLPAPPTPLCGRERESLALKNWLTGSGRRLVTVAGPGGVGKTSLAVAVAAQATPAFPDGAAFVPLAPLADPALVLSTIARSLCVGDAGSDPPAQRLQTAIGDRELLLVLDNFEHVIAAASALVDLLATCPNLRLLVTSREALRVRGEHEFPLHPLPLPPADAVTRDTAGAYDAVRLFVERAQAINPDFALTDENAPHVAAICRRLDGLPLALELAAGQTRFWGPAALLALLARLDRRLPLLTAGPLDLPPRLRTMRDAIGWSYDLLTEDEQAYFRRLAVFAGGFTLEAAEAVCGPRGTGNREQGTGEDGRAPVPRSLTPLPSNVLDGIAALVVKSLLRCDRDTSGEPCFAMLETIREYGRERLVAAGEEDVTRRRHAAYFRALAERARAAYLGAVEPDWLDRVERAHDNFRAALAWLELSGDAEGLLSLAGALAPFWSMRSHRTGGRAWLARALRHGAAGSPTARARALLGAAGLAFGQADCAAATPLAEQALALWRQLGDRWGIANTLNLLGAIARARGAYDEAVPRFEEAARLFDALGDRAWAALARCNLGVTAYWQGDLARAAIHLDRALVEYRALDDPWGIAVASSPRALVAADQGDLGGAVCLLRDSLAHWRALGTKEILADWLARTAIVAVAHGRALQGVRCLGAAEAIARSIPYDFEHPERLRLAQTADAARAILGASCFAAAHAEGQEAPSDRMIAEADVLLTELERVPVAPPPPEPDVTPREREVLRLVAEGLADKEIAAALGIGLRTAQSHVARLLVKLRVPSRTAAAAYALRHRLV